MLEFVVLLGTIISSSAGLGYWLAGKFSSLEMRVSKLEQDLSSLKQDFTTLKEDVSGLKGLREDFSGLKQDFATLKEDVRTLKSAFERLDEGVRTLKTGIFGFNELLLEVLKEKDIITEIEHTSMMGALRAYIPTSTSKYYTEEVRKKLIEILNKKPSDYTMDDVYELRRIADLMIKEYCESGRKREDLLDYAGQLYVASLMIKVLYVKPKLLKAGIKPPEERYG
ncbi:hypothetical protein [Candidatus Methanodesulfokora washburnensis]|jgi:cell division protein FtsB|uniref:Uncharacterized protein n=1 Tax=Candidatus Methanodesulfokora washburnensis TaxID=2478471 RepID=A0A3R9QC96_9CREN|nr:hypothetical protein [Candidatus Methanodesulfokores washburnensis]RSN73021.1 hypothetical protein D6D85_11625 [Candidatus Methanodesulfokores washburnensis]